MMQGAKYDQVIEIDLDKLEPHINGPFTPDLATPLSKFADKARAEKWPIELGAGLIGSCTNSSYEDMARAASICEQALSAGAAPWPLCQCLSSFLKSGSRQLAQHRSPGAI